MSRGGRVLRRALLAAVLAAFVVACLRLGWWQFERYHASGSLQNLGYTLQWPTFAAFAIFMVWRLRRLERQRAGEPDAATVGPRQTAQPVAADQRDEPEDELAAYNRYLAELHQKEHHRGN